MAQEVGRRLAFGSVIWARTSFHAGWTPRFAFATVSPRSSSGTPATSNGCPRDWR